MAEEITAVQ